MEYDEGADVFSYGIVLFEIITREKVSVALQRSPMDAFDLDERKTRNLLPKDCPSDFAELAFKCCRYESNQRPNFRAIVGELAAMIKTFPAPVKPNAHGAHRGASPRGAPNMRVRGGLTPGSPRGGLPLGIGPNRGLPQSRPGTPIPRNN
jgi:hypothetical protein